MPREIPLTKGHVAIVDDEDYERVNQFLWHAHVDSARRTPYAIRKFYKKDGTYDYVMMHNFVTGYSMTDHVNADGLDNRRENLRQANHSLNSANRPKQRGKYHSKYKGVSWDKNRSKWYASIQVNGKQVYLGRFVGEVDAAKAYDNAAPQYFGEFAYLNFPQEVHSA